jgi:SNF2 family DNA or RNA helicase
MFTGTLLPYQDEAVTMMVDRGSALVAYDLGLGKTVLTIAACEKLSEQGRLDGAVLVVCLSSLKYQWANEITKFSSSSALVIDGSRQQREQQYADIAVDQPDYIIVNYEQVVNDWEQIISLSCIRGIVFDEATAIKSFRSKRAKKCKELAKGIPFRFALTGTPMENGRPEELYSIMQAVDSDVLGKRFDLFDKTFIVRNKFGGVDRYRNLDHLHERLKTACVRKTQRDPDVAPYLPDTIQKEPILVPFDRRSAQVYRSIAQMLLDDLEEAQNLFGSSWNVEQHYGAYDGSGNYDAQSLAWRGRIMSKVVALRQLSDHPKLLISSAEAFDPYSPGSGSEFLHSLLRDDEELRSRLMSAKSLKLPALVNLVTDHLDIDPSHKVVVFCSYVEMAKMIQESVGGVLYTGQLNAKEQQAAKVSFQTMPDVRVLVSTDAGGYGVDLPQANLLVNYDLPWSSGLAIQRNGRIRRASSKWPSIVVQDLLVDESIEVRQYEMIQQKSSVASAVVDGRGIDTRGGIDLTVSTLANFLRSTLP